MSKVYSWEDALAFIKKAKLDSDEGLSVAPGVGGLRHPERFDTAQPVYGDGTRWIECSWVEGGSEGYYIHVVRCEEIRTPSGWIAELKKIREQAGGMCALALSALRDRRTEADPIWAVSLDLEKRTEALTVEILKYLDRVHHEREMVLLGKCWTPEFAALACWYLTEFFRHANWGDEQIKVDQLAALCAAEIGVLRLKR